MATFFATHEPFLRTQAKLLILPMSSDGLIVNTVLVRANTLYPSNYEHYKKQAQSGQLQLGDVLLHKTEKHITGLSAPSNHTADYIANLITVNHAHHSTELSTLKTALTALKPQIFELVRYQGLRQVAFLATPLFYLPTGNPAFTRQNPNRPVTPAQFWQLLISTLDTPRLTITVHFAKEIALDFVSELP